MISLSEVGGLYRSIPANLKDARTGAFAYACDMQIKKLLECAEKAKVWCAVYKVDEKYLDYLAADCRALFYEPSLDSQAKRELIANSQYWYMKLGTADAMREILQVVFHGNETDVEEWFEYGGEPWHFRVKVSIGEIPIGEQDFDMFRGMLETIKRKGAVLDYLEANVHAEVVAFLEVSSRVEFFSDFYPRNNIPLLYLDGAVFLDGHYLLNGYREGKQIDFYPVSMEISQAIQVACAWNGGFGVSAVVEASSKTVAGLTIVGKAGMYTGTTSRLWISTAISRAACCWQGRVRASADAEVPVKTEPALCIAGGAGRQVGAVGGLQVSGGASLLVCCGSRLAVEYEPAYLDGGRTLNGRWPLGAGRIEVGLD